MHVIPALYYFIPTLFPWIERNTENPVIKPWVIAAISAPALFHGLIYAVCSHLNYVRHSAIYGPNTPFTLSHKVATIQHLNKLLLNPDLAPCDEVIVACLSLATVERVAKEESDSNPFNSPLVDMNLLNIYGSSQIVPEHMNAMYRLIAMKGGLEKMELPAANEMIIL